MYYANDGNELKKFHTRDGKGLELLRMSGVICGIITGETTQIVANRAKKLKLDFVYQGISEKRVILAELMKKYNVAIEEVAYIGDDINDEPVLHNVGFGACPSDAVDEIKSLAHYTCNTKGGNGCVREFAEVILKHNQQFSS
jgi:N-acylneuraminate cytidylyltransferase